uniref:CCT domain-containing protein n=1 Tax=Oryza meridionalis TaxID=40149 RepID=A0A0E0DSP3_9ORYZ
MFHPSSSSPPTYSDSSMHHALSFSSALPTAPTEIPGSGGGFVYDKGSMFSLPNVAGSAPPPSYYSSLPSFYIHRSTSSHSLLHHRLSEELNSNAAFSYSSAPACQLQPLPPVSSSTSSSSGDLLEFSSGTLRRVFSTGDLQVMNVPPSPPPPPPFSGDICSQEVGGPFSQKVGRYSAEERKERIERYRVKRQQRNFHKKITVLTYKNAFPFPLQAIDHGSYCSSSSSSSPGHFQYACRKTLADSRPRVQGRFARNAETEAEADADADADAVAGLDTEVYSNGYGYCSYNGLTNSTSSNCYDSQSQWWGTPAGAANWQHQQQKQQLGFDGDGDDEDDELWASIADMCSGT